MTSEQQKEYVESKRRNAKQRERGDVLASQLKRWLTQVALVLAGTIVTIFVGEGWPGNSSHTSPVCRTFTALWLSRQV